MSEILADPGNYGYTFGGREAVAQVKPGAPIKLRTLDCFGGKVRTVDDLPSQVCEFPYLNPVTGPLHVEGAQPGDTLAVHIVSLTPASPFGISSTFPHFGALTSTGYTRTLQAPLEERVWLYDLDLAAGTVRYQARNSDYTVDLPLAPMLGTVGVAPAANEVRQTIVPDVHGGNLDTPLLGPGATLYLGVNVPGALLALGDGHARQGDGEVCGVAVEVAMDVTIVVDVIPGVPTGTPRLETDTQLVSLGAARPLEDAFRISQEDLVRHVAGLTGLDLLDAYQLVSQTTSARAGNVVDPQYVMSAAIDKRYLPGAVAYGGVHDRLRAG
ncbi:acetamidase/formamidase family protein [Actinoplanes regularis]|uniref:Acetamidase/formamidase n=1 Tax=Actinoplanes regularis TaxID=52697 RepID=A0A239K1T9_9ACTN|nr:acetamidase/formamidase family protein [Actinoplanes regularis]GIE92331.1 amidase [Actinoplanes regularis]GLW35323.1 amidase [Actinoplanes regularis]SNT11689.1 Acetamidase/formamidase [Actinoplanes regularis]